jgi:hypothetical protein
MVHSPALHHLVHPRSQEGAMLGSIRLLGECYSSVSVSLSEEEPADKVLKSNLRMSEEASNCVVCLFCLRNCFSLPVEACLPHMSKTNINSIRYPVRNVKEKTRRPRRANLPVDYSPPTSD